jgi:hypothetical protein
MADIKKLLRDNIQTYSNADQRPYAGLAQDIAATQGLNNDCSRIAVTTLQKILIGAETDSLDGLKTRLDRIAQLETYVKAAQVGAEEEGTLLGMVSATKKAITTHLQQKRAMLSRASNLIRNASGDVSSVLLAMSKNDPLMKMVLSGGGAVARMIRNNIQSRRAARDTRRESLRQDAVRLYQDTTQAETQAQMAEQQQKESQAEAFRRQAEKDAERAKRKAEKDAEAARKKAEKDAEKAQKTQEREEAAAWKARAKQKQEEQKKKDQQDAAWKQKAKEQDQEEPQSMGPKKAPEGFRKGTKAYETSSGQITEITSPLEQAPSDVEQMGDSLVRIEHIMSNVSSNIGDLVVLGEENRTMTKNMLFDQQEAQTESLVQASALANRPLGASEDKKQGIMQKLSSIVSGGSNFLGTLLGSAGGAGAGAAVGGAGAIAAALVLPVIDGIAGFLKSQDWGVSRISGFLGSALGGSFNSKLVNVFANAGKWAVMGATLGAPLFGIGAIAGGLIGAVVGGVLGIFGGQKIAKFFDGFGGMVMAMWSKVSAAFSAGLEIAKTSLTWVASKVEVLFEPLKEGITVVLDFMNNIKDKFLGWIDSITPEWAKNAAGYVVDSAKAGVSDVTGAVSTIASSVGGAASSAYDYMFGVPEASASINNSQGELERTLLSNMGTKVEGFDYASYASKLGQRESGGDYGIQNSLGFAGKYQFGSQALEDLGLLKKGASKKGRVKSVLSDPNNWAIEGGLQAFLNNPEMQEDAMMRFTKKNLLQLQKLGVVKASDSSDKIAGALAGSHLGGVGNVQKYYNGIGFQDAYGTSIAEYVNLGKNSQYAMNQMGAAPSRFKPNYDLVNTKSAKASQPIVLVNNAQSVNTVNSGGGKGGGTSSMSSNATSGRRASQIAGSSK